MPWINQYYVIKALKGLGWYRSRKQANGRLAIQTSDFPGILRRIEEDREFTCVVCGKTGRNQLGHGRNRILCRSKDCYREWDARWHREHGGGGRHKRRAG